MGFEVLACVCKAPHVYIQVHHVTVQRSARTNFINDLYRKTTLVLRYDLRIITFAVIHVTIPIMFSDIGRPTASHDKVWQMTLLQH